MSLREKHGEREGLVRPLTGGRAESCSVAMLRRNKYQVEPLQESYGERKGWVRLCAVPNPAASP